MCCQAYVEKAALHVSFGPLVGDAVRHFHFLAGKEGERHGEDAGPR